MRINNNMMAMNTHRQLGAANAGGAKSMEKLSSGMRINRAGDDAAGLAISEKMRGQIRGLNQASANSQDGISLIQTAEGALNETHAILQRMRELAVQSSTDTNTDEDRAEIQKEINQLGDEIDRISDTTQFNTKNLLDGSMGKGVNAAVANTNSNTALAAGTNADVATTTELNALTDASGNSLGIASGDKITVSFVQNGETITDDITVGTNTAVSGLIGSKASGKFTFSVATTGDTKGHLIATAATGGFKSAIHGVTVTVKDSDGKVRTGATNALSSFTETKAAENIRADGQATFHIGANTGQNIQLSIENMGSSALGVKDLKVGNQGQSNVAIKVLDSATQKVSAERSKLGAAQNRLEHTIKNLDTSAENLQASEARIRDVDMAKEMMEQTRQNILAQASTAMLAQANQAPQSVLQLLG